MPSRSARRSTSSRWYGRRAAMAPCPRLRSTVARHASIAGRTIRRRPRRLARHAPPRTGLPRSRRDSRLAGVLPGACEQGDLAGLVGPLEQIATGEHGEPLCAGDARRRTGRLGRRGGGAAHPRSAHPRRHSSEPNGECMGGGACLADGGRRRRIVELTCGAALRAPRAVRGRLLVTVIGLACLGAADRYQGMLSTTLERWDAAEAHFERALDLEQRIRGRALVPRTRYWQARFLQARGGPGDDRSARAILRGVVQDTRELGMRRLGEQAEERLARSTVSRRLSSSVATGSPGRSSASRRPGRRHRWSRPRPWGSAARPNLREPPGRGG